MLTIENVQKKSRSKAPLGAYVTKKVAARVGEFPTQACISLRGDEVLAAHRGEVRLTLGKKSFVIRKGDSHLAWVTKQGDRLPDFVAVFNALSANPGEVAKVEIA